MSSLTEIQYFQIEPSDTGTLTIEIGSLECFIFKDLSDEQTSFDELDKIIISSFISFLSLQLNEFLQSEINKKLSSVRKITYIVAIVDKEIVTVFRRRI